MGKYKDKDSAFKFTKDNNDGSSRQDRYDNYNEKGGHEHTWSKTSTDGGHKEGWHGNDSKD